MSERNLVAQHSEQLPARHGWSRHPQPQHLAALGSSVSSSSARASWDCPKLTESIYLDPAICRIRQIRLRGLNGQLRRRIDIADNHAAEQWAQGIRRLVQEDYPQATRITSPGMDGDPEPIQSTRRLALYHGRRTDQAQRIKLKRLYPILSD